MPIIRPVTEDGGRNSHYHLQILLYHGMPGSGRQYRANNSSTIYTKFRPFFQANYYTQNRRADVLAECNGDRRGPNIALPPDVVVPMTHARNHRELGGHFIISENAEETQLLRKTDVIEQFGISEEDSAFFKHVHVKRVVIITPPDVWLEGQTSMDNYTEWLDSIIQEYARFPENNEAYPSEQNFHKDISHIWGELDTAGRSNVGRIRCNLKKLWSTRNSTIYTQRINFWNNYANTYFNAAKQIGRVTDFGGSDIAGQCSVVAEPLSELPDSIAGGDVYFNCNEFGGR